MSAGQIHDLGYKRYVGSRRSVGTRWTVIMRHQLATAWKTWWRYKVWLVAALIATAVSGGVLYFLSGNLFQMLRGLGGQGIKFADGVLAISMSWYCPIGFVTSLFIGATVVAGDVQSGAFTFYFARSVRPHDYVLGKLAGLGVLLSLVMLAGPLVLAGLRLELSHDLDQLIEALPTLSKTLAIGALGTLVYAAVPLGFSALIANRRYALGLWAAYYIVLGSMVQPIALFTTPAIAAIDPASALKSLSLDLFDVHMVGRDVAIPTSVALISIFGHAGAAIGLVFWRVRRAQQTGVGGAS